MLKDIQQTLSDLPQGNFICVHNNSSYKWYSSISGNTLRSKSETIIDMLLFQTRIPYRYECPIILGTHIIYPDFTIRHPITGKIFYWEHFGQMDNSEYYPKACDKLRLYTAPNCGI